MFHEIEGKNPIQVYTTCWLDAGTKEILPKNFTRLAPEIFELRIWIFHPITAVLAQFAEQDFNEKSQPIDWTFTRWKNHVRPVDLKIFQRDLRKVKEHKSGIQNIFCLKS